MIYAKIHNFLDSSGNAQQCVAARSDQLDATWIAYDVPDASWLSLINGEIVKATTTPNQTKSRDNEQPYIPMRKFELPYKAVRIQCLNKDGAPIKHAYASGFVCKEGEWYFLYTCWHVVTGFNMHDIKIGHKLPERFALQVSPLQSVTRHQNGVTVLGGGEPPMIVPLYDTSQTPSVPLWIQDKEDIPQLDLNAINLHVPARHDAVKLRLPSSLDLSDLQIIDRNKTLISTPEIGEKVFIVGYPYSFSASGDDFPCPVVLTRFVASTLVSSRLHHILLDGAGAEGMSGSPVFKETPGLGLFLVGLYTGLIYPDYVIERNERITALGLCCNLWTF